MNATAKHSASMLQPLLVASTLIAPLISVSVQLSPALATAEGYTAAPYKYMCLNVKGKGMHIDKAAPSLICNYSRVVMITEPSGKTRKYSRGIYKPPLR